MKFTPKFYKRGFFIFGIFNLLFIGLILLAPKKRPDHKAHLKHVVEKLNDILALDSKQQAKLQAIFDQHQNEIDSIKKITQRIHKKFIDCLSLKNSDCDSLKLVQPSFEMILYKHHQRIINLLNSKQKEKYLLELKTKKPKDSPPF
jgi:hypothetical protein